MICIKTIHIEEFRGIRRLDLDLGAKNFGICGPNGTGKSGAVDAIEFCLTGDVTRLTGQGSAGLSVKTHAPHVDQHDHPQKAIVTITAWIPSLKKAVKIHRSVKNPRKVEVSPADADVMKVIEELQTHPEFALSRREIVKYIITPPGKRSEDVQTLLRLEHLEKLRKSLTTFSNKSKAEAEEAQRNRLRAETELRTVLKIDTLERELVLERVNEKRKILSLQSLTELKKDVSFKTGVSIPKTTEQKPALRKPLALADLLALRSSIEVGEPIDLLEARQKAKAILEKLKADEQALSLALKKVFIKTGLDLVSENACPLCDREWNADELRAYLRNKLRKAEESEESEQCLEQLRNYVNTVLQSLSERIQGIERTIQYAQNVRPLEEQTVLVAYLEQIKNDEIALKDFLKDPSLVEPALQAVALSWWSPAAAQQAVINDCVAVISSMPDTSVEDEARDILVVAQERYEKLLITEEDEKERKKRALLIQKVLDYYNLSCTTVLEGIYNHVAKEFSTFYGIINHEDEEKFAGKLKSTPAKLSFDVDFYGRGLFPPGAYHSEGHQDAMGLCLYLALMKHTLGDKFTFAVLDDVLMSVDTGHRRAVCRLLKSHFPKTQFIVTTHDRVWLQYMKTEGLIGRSQTFAGWTVDTGPRIWDDQDIWTEIQSALDKNDVAKAAWLLRYYLEYTATILADKLRVPVEFRGDGHYDLGDLMPRVLKEWQKRLDDGEKSAGYWKRADEKTALTAKRMKANKLIKTTNVELWAINPSVHFNEWSNLQPQEFEEVVRAHKDLLENLRCENENCRSYLYIIPRKGKAEAMRCNCGTTSINLKASA